MRSDRVLMLNGLTNLQSLGKMLIDENAAEVRQCDLKLEAGAEATLQDALAHCEGVSD